jgi:hypothetical protein
MMDGADIIGTLLRNDEAVIAKVIAPQIRLGRLAEDAPLPSLLGRTISVVERIKLKRTGKIRMTERVAVTVRAASYRDQVTIMKLLPAACAGKTGDFGAATGVSVQNAGVGPDVDGPGNSFEQTVDFRVSYEIPA